MGVISRISTNSREDWLALRHKYIGGSDAAAVVGMNVFSSPYALWAEKTGKTPPFEGNMATKVGTFLEEFVAQEFTATTGKKVRRCNQSIFNSDYPWAIANIDREIVGEDAGLEIKTTSELNLKRFKGGDFPVHYYVQCIHYLAVTGKKRWYLAVLIGNKDLRIFVIERDEEEIAALMKQEESFWYYVQNDLEPPADGSKATSEAIKTIYVESNGTSVDLYGYEQDLENYFRLKKQIDELSGMREEIANRLKVYMGEAAMGEVGSYKVTWQTQPRKTFDAKRFAADHPSVALEKYYKTSTSRVFKVTEKKEKNYGI